MYLCRLATLALDHESTVDCVCPVYLGPLFCREVREATSAIRLIRYALVSWLASYIFIVPARYLWWFWHKKFKTLILIPHTDIIMLHLSKVQKCKQKHHYKHKLSFSETSWQGQCTIYSFCKSNPGPCCETFVYIV